MTGESEMAKADKLSEVENFARVLMAATAEEPEAGGLALACVVRNRREIARRFSEARSRAHPHFGDGSLAKACRSVLRDAGLPNAATAPPAPNAAGPDYYRALATACLVLSGDQADPTQGAVDFHRHDELPDWASKRVPTALIGSRLFYPPD